MARAKNGLKNKLIAALKSIYTEYGVYKPVYLFTVGGG